MKRTHFTISGKQHDLGLALTWAQDEGHSVINITQYIFPPAPLELRFSFVIQTSEALDIADIEQSIAVFNQNLLVGAS